MDHRGVFFLLLLHTFLGSLLVCYFYFKVLSKAGESLRIFRVHVLPHRLLQSYLLVLFDDASFSMLSTVDGAVVTTVHSAAWRTDGKSLTTRVARLFVDAQNVIYLAKRTTPDCDSIQVWRLNGITLQRKFCFGFSLRIGPSK